MSKQRIAIYISDDTDEEGCVNVRFKLTPNVTVDTPITPALQLAARIRQIIQNELDVEVAQ